MSEPSPPIRASTAAPPPPTRQEIERKLGSPTAVSAPPPPSIESGSASQSHAQSGGEEEESSWPSPPRHTIPLAAISETDDALASGSESDASSDGERRPPRQTFSHDDYAPSRASRDSGGLSENIALKSAYLMKKGERRKAWKKRWFVLRGGQLAMYKSDKEYRLLRLIPITEIHMAAPIEMKKHAHTFGIVTPRRTYYIKAESSGEVNQWCYLIERARSDARARQTVMSTDLPIEDNLPTPMGHSPAETPTGHASPTPTSAIPIPNMTQGVTESRSFLPQSYATTASTSLTSPSALASSSYASTSTSSGLPGFAPQMSSSPQSHLGLQQPSLIDETDLQLLSSGVQRLRLPSQDASSRSMSSGSESLAPPVGLQATASSSGGYDSTSSYDMSRASQPSPSPGIVSSSEDEDGFDAYAGPSWSTPGVVDKTRRQVQSNSYFAQAVQAQPPPPPLTAPSMLQPVSGTSLEPEPDKGVNRVQSGFADPNKVILAGYLMKQGKRKSWRKRWFVLMSGMLMYSRSHMDTKMNRQIPLSAILDAIEYEGPSVPTRQRSLPLSTPSEEYPRSLGDGKKNYEHCFKIITPKRTYLVCAPSEEDEIKWLAALQCLVARKSSQGTPGSLLSPPTSASIAQTLSSPLPAPLPTTAQQLSQRQRSQDETSSTLAPPPSNPAPVSRPIHGRHRSLTEAAQSAVRDVEKRFHFQTAGAGGVKAA
ncbi:uncharacterized protein JCM15063_001117 [Sporobolomyces koalae]|uniref:uncharacterized protein n=1 Tax=Sporobolomyces koalae TaxID=500713 RepID=UPI00317BDC99